jgi:hypothetical protein
MALARTADVLLDALEYGGMNPKIIRREFIRRCNAARYNPEDALKVCLVAYIRVGSNITKLAMPGKIRMLRLRVK